MERKTSGHLPGTFVMLQTEGDGFLKHMVSGYEICFALLPALL
jgi:hypothetical protein